MEAERADEERVRTVQKDRYKSTLERKVTGRAELAQEVGLDKDTYLRAQSHFRSAGLWGGTLKVGATLYSAHGCSAERAWHRRLWGTGRHPTSM